MELAESNNWYAFLRLSPAAREDEIQSAVERLSRQASALAVTAPERSQSLRETVRAIKRDLLSGPESRRRYDASHPQRPALAAQARRGAAAARCRPRPDLCRPAGTYAGPARTRAARAGAVRIPGTRLTPGPVPAYRLDLPRVRQWRRTERQVLHQVRYPHPAHPAGSQRVPACAQAASSLRHLHLPAWSDGRVLFQVRPPRLTCYREGEQCQPAPTGITCLREPHTAGCAAMTCVPAATRATRAKSARASAPDAAGRFPGRRRET